MPILQAQNLIKTFQDGREEVTILKGVSLSLERGQVVSLEGPSGSGKTTLLSILGCILSATSGELIVDGTHVDPRRTADFPRVRRQSVGFVFQQFNLFPSLTALENVQFALNIKGTKGSDARNEAERVLTEVGLEERMHFLPQNLSGGQKQRVAIARAIAGRPPLLFADEPTANLDSQIGRQILKLFRDLAKRENCALLIVTHDPKVREVADTVLHIEDGVLVQGEVASDLAITAHI